MLEGDYKNHLMIPSEQLSKGGAIQRGGEVSGRVDLGIGVGLGN